MSEQTITQRATSTTVSLTPELAMMLIRYISTSALDGRDFQLTINTMTALHQSDSTEDPIATLQVGESISQTLYPRLKQSFSTITGQDVEVHYNGAVGA